MSDRALKVGIAARNFQVGIADAGKQYAHQRLVGARGFMDIAEVQALGFNSEGFHDGCQVSGVGCRL